jgi:hypothetical protein
MNISSQLVNLQQCENNLILFTKEGNYGCILNVDWFQPYKHAHYSIDVMYLAFCNLPRDQRFRRENMLLVGPIPDMKSEPKTNTFVLIHVTL